MEYNGVTADGLKAIASALELSAYEHKKSGATSEIESTCR